MVPVTDAFKFNYFGSDIVYGRGCVDQLNKHLEARGLTNGLIVCGSNVGANADVMGPVQQGMADKIAGVFDGTTPAKAAETMYDGIEMMQEVDPDFLVGLGGGSSLDIARQMSVFAADGRPLSDFRSAAEEGRVKSPNPTEPLTPVVVIPTTFAGADISSGGSIEFLSAENSPTGHPIRISGSVMPEAMIYDPNLFETTPISALTGSAMNGFDKGIETIYSRNTTPITDATAVHGLRLLRKGFSELPNGGAATEHAVIGLILVQFERSTSIVHAFGHAFARRYPVQQGIIHAIVVPHVLNYLLENTDGGRDLLAMGLGVNASSLSDSDVAAAIIESVIQVRDGFDLPTRLRSVDVINKKDLPSIAEFILADDAMRRVPEKLDASAAEIEAVLREAW